MTTQTEQRSYTIKEVAALTGLAASTLRYYESVGVIPPIGRGASSGHRVYDERDLDQLMGISCLAATGMSVSDMREYVASVRVGAEAAQEQIALLAAQEKRLAVEAKQLKLRQRYVRLKVSYWESVDAGDTDRALEIGAEAMSLADALHKVKTD